jgi:hypothetical protein
MSRRAQLDLGSIVEILADLATTMLSRMFEFVDCLPITCLRDG